MVLALIAVWFLICEPHRGQQVTPALTLPHVRYGLSLLLTNGVSILQTKLSHREGHEARCRLTESAKSWGELRPQQVIQTTR